MAVGFNYISDLMEVYNTTQNTMIRVAKDFIIATLKNYFAQDSRYHYVTDEWGFAKATTVEGTNTEDGINNDVVTRVYIGEKYRYSTVFYPAILVSASNFKYVPVSFSRDHHVVEYDNILFSDGYGNTKLVKTPVAFTPEGATEGTISIDILSRGIRERDDLVELIYMLFTDYAVEELYRSGLSILSKPDTGSPSDSEDRNDKLFKQTISFNVRGEWIRKIPIKNVIDVIAICIDIGNLEVDPPQLDPNLEIMARLEILDAYK